VSVHTVGATVSKEAGLGCKLTTRPTLKSYALIQRERER